MRDYTLSGLKPREYLTPVWPSETETCVHDWRAYVNEPLRAIWSTFAPAQKLAIAVNAQMIADQEDWD